MSSSFIFTSCPAPLAVTSFYRNGRMAYTTTSIADESLWLADFNKWAKTRGAITLFESLEPEATLGIGWSEVIEDYADEHLITLSIDDKRRIFNALDTAGGHAMALADSGLLATAVDAMVDFVITHARRAFDAESRETALHAGEVVTGGIVCTKNEDMYPSKAFASVSFMRGVSYFNDLAPFQKAIVLDAN